MHIDAEAGLDDIRHEAIVCVRLKTTVAGSHLLEHLRVQPYAVSAWWIAADLDAVVLLSAPSMRELHRAVDARAAVQSQPSTADRRSRRAGNPRTTGPGPGRTR